MVKFNNTLNKKSELENDKDSFYPVFSRAEIKQQLFDIEIKKFKKSKKGDEYDKLLSEEKEKNIFPSDNIKYLIRDYSEDVIEYEFSENRLNKMLQANIDVLNGSKKINEVDKDKVLCDIIEMFDKIKQGKLRYEEWLERIQSKKEPKK
ncbi:MAG: hypothetical protein V1902_00135 [Candidatus Falkowbacteria bacterium]